MDCVVHEVAKSWAQLSDFHFYPHTLLQCFHYVSSIVSFELRKCTFNFVLLSKFFQNCFNYSEFLMFLHELEYQLLNFKKKKSNNLQF